MRGSRRTDGATITETLARWTAGLTWESLPPAVVTMAKRIVLDAVGCALHGSATPEAARLAAAGHLLGAGGPCTVWGSDAGLAPGAAALLNGTHAHLRELDDIGGGGHAGACQVPAALAAAELLGHDGRAVILGLVAGHEVTSRLSDAASYDTMTLHGWHTTGVYGSFGAAAAAARVAGLDEAGVADALGLTGSFTGGIWAFMDDGATSKRVHPGKSAETGLTAVLLARAGVDGPRRVLEAPWGGFFETYAPGAADPGAILKDLGDGFRILRKGFKPYPVCWGINSSADSAFALRAAHGLTGDRVQRVRITLSEMSRRMIGGTPDTLLAAQMSVTYAVATVLARGRLTLDDFTEEARTDPAVRALMKRIELVVDPAAHGERQTIDIETRDGAHLTSRVETPRGHWDNPLSGAELRAKFLGLAEPTLGKRAVEVVDLLEGLDEPRALLRALALLRASR